MPAWQVTSRPRSPNPTHMPEDLNKPPALRPGLSEHAKNWVEIAVSQRSSPGGLSGTDRRVRICRSLLHCLQTPLVGQCCCQLPQQFWRPEWCRTAGEHGGDDAIAWLEFFLLTQPYGGKGLSANLKHL